MGNHTRLCSRLLCPHQKGNPSSIASLRCPSPFGAVAAANIPPRRLQACAHGLCCMFCTPSTVSLYHECSIRFAPASPKDPDTVAFPNHENRQVVSPKEEFSGKTTMYVGKPIYCNVAGPVFLTTLLLRSNVKTMDGDAFRRATVPPQAPRQTRVAATLASTSFIRMMTLLVSACRQQLICCKQAHFHARSCSQGVHAGRARALASKNY